MRVGIDSRKIPEFAERGPLRSLDHVRELGLEGIAYRTVLDMSPSLDSGELRDIRAHADELGLYLESGLGKVNPYALAEAPEIRAVGDGDTLLGFERMLRACAAIGCYDLWVGTANYKAQYHGSLAYDRFRTDVAWSDQLVAIERFLRLLAPLARELGIHMNLETHEEITSFEVVRLVEAVGPDVLGVTFDVANVVQRGEDPVAAAARVLPYVRQTHLKDAVLYFVADGLQRQERPCGQGLVDYQTILPMLETQRPDLHLSIELRNPTSSATLQIYDPAWQAAHPDLRLAEMMQLVRHARHFEQRVAAGQVPSPDAYRSQPFGYAEEVQAIHESAAHLRSIVGGPPAAEATGVRDAVGATA